MRYTNPGVVLTVVKPATWGPVHSVGLKVKILDCFGKIALFQGEVHSQFDHDKEGRSPWAALRLLGELGNGKSSRRLIEVDRGVGVVAPPPQLCCWKLQVPKGFWHDMFSHCKDRRRVYRANLRIRGPVY